MIEDEDRGLDDRPEILELFARLKAALPAMKALLEVQSDHWHYEDPVYRLYHQSWKVYHLQEATQEIVEALRALRPGRRLNLMFEQIFAEGTGKTFDGDRGRDWLEATRPIVEAFFHARWFLEMAVCHGKGLEQPPQRLPSGWAALLYLYDLR